MAKFGELLKSWRQRRRLSQLELGITANVSARHISFLETGRSRPSQPMVMMLARHLDVPRDVCNQLLSLAGFAPAFAARAPSDAEMAPAQEAVSWMLNRHAPYPGFAFDRHWTLLALNPPATALFASVGISKGDNLLAAYLENEALVSALENAGQILEHTLTRIRIESAHFGGDDVLDEAAKQLAAMLPDDVATATGPMPPFLPAIFRMGDMRLSFFSTIAQFGSAEDIALAEMRVELLFPADDATKAVLN